MEWLFVLKDKGTSNQGWWLKLTNADELLAYYEATMHSREESVLEEYLAKREEEYPRYSNLTQAVVMNASKKRMNIFDAIRDLRLMVASQQLESIHKYGAIYVNSLGGYHSAYEGEPKYDFVRRDKLVYPDFKAEDIRIKQFKGGEHYYAYIGDMQVRDGDILKWDSYDNAYKKALEMVCR